MKKELLDSIKSAYENAAGNWTEADWCHHYEVDGVQYDEDDCPIHCYGDEPGCSLCASAKSDAAAAEELGAKAMKAVEDGDFEKALNLAKEAAFLEYNYGDDPTWGPFQRAIEAGMEGDEE